MPESIVMKEDPSVTADILDNQGSRQTAAPPRIVSWAGRHRTIAWILGLLLLLVYTAGSDILGLLPSPTFVAIALLGWWLYQSLGTLTRPVSSTPLAPVSSEQPMIEAELSKSDTDGVGKVIRLSRLELARFYNLTIGQTQGSYRWALGASWLGLLVILAGILQLFGILTPLSHQKSSALGTPTASLVTISAGAVVELVSVLFLTVYRSADRRFSYFYDRQMQLYSVFIASRISAGMADPDAAKRTIIEQILKTKWTPEEVRPTRRVRQSWRRPPSDPPD